MTYFLNSLQGLFIYRERGGGLSNPFYLGFMVERLNSLKMLI